MLPRVTALISPVLVGRQSELDALAAAFQRGAGGEPAVVLVGGEAGVGKTRLVEEAASQGGGGGGGGKARVVGGPASQAPAGAVGVLTGAGAERGSAALPLAPLVDIL